MSDRKTFTITVGRLIAGRFRNFLKKCIFEEADIEFIESKGFASIDFIVKGSSNDIRVIKNYLKQYVN